MWIYRLDIQTIEHTSHRIGFCKFLNAEKRSKKNERRRWRRRPPNDDVMENEAIPIVLLPWHSFLIIFITTFVHCPIFYIVFISFSLLLLSCAEASSYYDHWTDNQEGKRKNQFISSIACLHNTYIYAEKPARELILSLLLSLACSLCVLLVHEMQVIEGKYTTQSTFETTTTITTKNGALST